MQACTKKRNPCGCIDLPLSTCCIMYTCYNWQALISTCLCIGVGISWHCPRPGLTNPKQSQVDKGRAAASNIHVVSLSGYFGRWLYVFLSIWHLGTVKSLPTESCMVCTRGLRNGNVVQFLDLSPVGWNLNTFRYFHPLSCVYTSFARVLRRSSL